MYIRIFFHHIKLISESDEYKLLRTNASEPPRKTFTTMNLANIKTTFEKRGIH